MTLLAIVLPWLPFLLRKKWYSALVALIFHVLAILSLFPTGIGFAIWLAVAAWAVLAHNFATIDKLPPNKKQNDTKRSVSGQ